MIDDRYATIEALVAAAYPDHSWDWRRFTHQRGTNMFTPQIFMSRVVRSLFPNEKLELNVRAGHGILNTSGRSLEVDVYISNLKLGFEYQVFYLSLSPPPSLLSHPLSLPHCVASREVGTECALGTRNNNSGRSLEVESIFQI